MEAQLNNNPTIESKPINKRIGYVDIGKFLAILIVVIYHAFVYVIDLGLDFPVSEGFNFYWQASLNNFGQFVVPFFFFAMGITYVYGKYTSYKQYVRYRFYSLVIPFILIFLLSAVIIAGIRAIALKVNFFHDLASDLVGLVWGSIYVPFEIPSIGLLRISDPADIISIGRIRTFPNMLIPLYFLQAFIPTSLVFMPLAELLKKDKLKHYHIYRGLTIIVLLLLTGIEPFLCKDWSLPFSLGYVPFFLLIMLMGLWLKEVNLFEVKKLWVNILLFVIGVGLLTFGAGFASGIIAFYANKFGGNSYLGILLSYISTIGGCICFIQISRLIDSLKIKTIPKFLRWLGQRTMPIYAFHCMTLGCVILNLMSFTTLFTPENKILALLVVILTIIVCIVFCVFVGGAVYKLFILISLKIKEPFDKRRLAKENRSVS